MDRAGRRRLRRVHVRGQRHPAAAQELQLSALGANRRLLKPLAGVTYKKLSGPTSSQALSAVTFMQRFLEGNDLTRTKMRFLFCSQWFYPSQ